MLFTIDVIAWDLWCDRVSANGRTSLVAEVAFVGAVANRARQSGRGLIMVMFALARRDRPTVCTGSSVGVGMDGGPASVMSGRSKLVPLALAIAHSPVQVTASADRSAA